MDQSRCLPLGYQVALEILEATLDHAQDDPAHYKPPIVIDRENRIVIEIQVVAVFWGAQSSQIDSLDALG